MSNVSKHRMHSGLAARGHGFSLVELLVVVVIAGILASIASPSFTAHLVRASPTFCSSSSWKPSFCRRSGA